MECFKITVFLCLVVLRMNVCYNAKLPQSVFTPSSVMSEPSVKTVPNILQYVVHNVNVYTHKIEDTFFVGCRSLDDDIRKSTRLFEDIISPASTRANDDKSVEPLPRGESDKIQTAVNTLRDFVWSMKSQENVFVADMRTIKNSVRDFARDVIDKFAINRTNAEYVQTKSRTLLDSARKTARGVQDRIRTNTRSLEDKVQSFVRTIEDVSQVIVKLPAATVNWGDERESQLRKMKSLSNSLVTDYDSSMNKYTQKLQMNVVSLEDQIEYGLRMLVNKFDSFKTK